MAITQVSPVIGRADGFAPTATVTRGEGHSLVRLSGEYDISSLFVLADALAVAISFDEADLVVDLSNVHFLSAASVGVLIRARNFLWVQSRDLTLQNPSPSARRVLDLCGLGDPAVPMRAVRMPILRSRSAAVRFRPQIV
jgi:anti-anti-sigma factor